MQNSSLRKTIDQNIVFIYDQKNGVVRVVSGEKLPILGRWQTVCQFDSSGVIAEFLVADVEPQEILLGADFLIKFSAVINLEQKSCRLMGIQIPLIFANDRDAQVREVIVHVNTSVPPRSEVQITGAVEGVVEGSQGMLEPSTSLNAHCDHLVARVVCKVEQGLLPIRVIKVTEATPILKCGMKVGTLFCDAEVEEGGGDCGNPMNTVDMLSDRLGLREKGYGESEMRASNHMSDQEMSPHIYELSDLADLFPRNEGELTRDWDPNPAQTPAFFSPMERINVQVPSSNRHKIKDKR
ncbi:hypothetical protein E1301_Tti005344 [Triplophysa tibetana]|uniref:Uncharacterized protein n=1 Tax=Triplophysa tibetana TaxID=1572043 RepID=A0A5A9PN41_9TELE|nr:hypothetical protein E1301_Tti005344 [Triplophysa tibetana]